MNNELLSAIEIQGGVDKRLPDFLRVKEIRDVAINNLSINCTLSLDQAVSFKNHGNFTDSQMTMVRSIGVKMPQAEEIRKEQAVRQVELIKTNIELEVKESKNSIKRDVPFIFFYFLICTLKHTCEILKVY